MARKRHEEEEEEAEEKRLEEEEERKIKELEDLRRRRIEREEKKKTTEEEELKKILHEEEEEEAERKRQEEEAERKRQEEEAERKRQKEAAALARKQQEEAERKKQQEEAERKRKEEESKRKRKVEIETKPSLRKAGRRRIEKSSKKPSQKAFDFSTTDTDDETDRYEEEDDEIKFDAPAHHLALKKQAVFPISLFGIINQGNMCFASAAIQCFIRIPVITKYFANRSFPIKSSSYLYQKLILLSKVIDPNPYFISLKLEALKESIHKKFSNQEQQDSHDFLLHMIDKLSEENQNDFHCKIQRSLKSIMRSTFTCQSCNNIDIIKEVFVIIDLTIEGNNTLDDCIKKVIGRYEIERTCPACGCLNASKVSCIIKWPNYLILSLNRRGNVHPIICTERINIGDYSRTFTGSYSLFGIIMYHGSIDFGHYYAIVKSKKDEWALIDDDTYKKVDINNYLDHNHIYILFYQLNSS